MMLSSYSVDYTADGVFDRLKWERAGWLLLDCATSVAVVPDYVQMKCPIGPINRGEGLGLLRGRGSWGFGYLPTSKCRAPLSPVLQESERSFSK